MSDYAGTDTFRGSAARAQTPEHTLRARAQQVPVFHGASGRTTARPLNTQKLPPSSFRDSPASRAPSRPGSRAGAYTPSMDNPPMHEYVPGNPKDPLDVEVAEIVNSIAHGLLIERVDPPLRKIPKEGEEIKAQYAFSNSLSRKVVTCRLTTLMRPGKAAGDATTKKVMCRVGGGWQDLSHYVLNRQAGM
ncbi:putative yeast cortical protein KAR9 [Lyophyllum shimeji]|uniref:Yeast cortical protein KAR9 n=1 Tax=Lyophyllum shimeji TaxID=47721 RepID=A0A9P3PUV1_LYOSH|nr:putative yeast cortical protein KAR9 [Lyophyllum shimeji]